MSVRMASARQGVVNISKSSAVVEEMGSVRNSSQPRYSDVRLIHITRQSHNSKLPCRR